MVSFAANPAIAHLVEISGDVGATLHIEPNDRPRAGEPSLTWFALTREGGRSIPLDACNCELAVYARSTSTDEPIQEPPLRAISAEGYQDIPGTEITFPEVGAYELVLRGEPITPEDFQPFELRFDITVAAGQAVQPPTQPSPAPERAEAPELAETEVEVATAEPQSENTWNLGAIALVSILGLGILWGIIRFGISRNH